MAKKLRCYVGLHRWVETVREKERYNLCRDCGKVRHGIREASTHGVFPPEGPPGI
jgi:hypothetical protein